MAHGLRSSLPLVALLGATSALAQLAGPPDSIGAAGDSITRAFDSASQYGQYGENLQYSWSTGIDAGIQSHYTRLLTLHPAIQDHTFNEAVTGAKVKASAKNPLIDQIGNLVFDKPAYVTVLIGANDACSATVDAMTDLATFQADLETSLHQLFVGLPDSRVLVTSIPDAYQLWTLFNASTSAQTAWTNFGVCQSLLANPTSTDPADVARRQQVRDQIIAFNGILKQTCERSLHCRYDDDAVFNMQFATGDVSHADYFHPSIAGQAKLAQVTFNAGFDFTDQVAPHTTPTVVTDGGSDVLTFSAVDDVAVRGIEYRENGSDWTVWDGGALELSASDTLAFRAVDVNGNTEDTWHFQAAEGLDGGSTGLSDAGRLEWPDAGAPDSGSDAGNPIQLPQIPPLPHGCGCESGPAGMVSMLLLAAWLTARALRKS